MSNVLKISAGSDPLTAGMSMKDILEKVNLFSFIEQQDNGTTLEDGTKKVMNNVVVNPESAYLGPKLWEKNISLDAIEDDAAAEENFSAEVMNIDEFLFENSLNIEGTSPESPENEDKNDEDEEEDESNFMMNATTEAMIMNTSSSSSSSSGIKRSLSTDGEEEKSTKSSSKRSKLLKGNNSFLYTESKRARMEREAEEKRRKEQEELDLVFAPEDLSLATVPGTTFDPKNRAFSTDELKPQPIIRKRKKEYIPSERKDQKYWEKRIKNNVAARRSREARRLKENQIALRAAFLEKENKGLKNLLNKSEAENQNLKDTISFLREKIRAYEQA